MIDMNARYAAYRAPDWSRAAVSVVSGFGLSYQGCRWTLA